MRSVTFHLFVAFVFGTRIWAAGGLDQTAFPGIAVDANRAQSQSWPSGTLGLVNDPVRTAGWQRWFTNIENYPEHFEFAPKTQADVQRLVNRFAAIKGERLILRFSRLSQPERIGAIRVRNNMLHQLRDQQRGGPASAIYSGRSTAAVFTIRDPSLNRIIDDADLTQKEKQPLYVYPTLVLYAGSKLVDPEALQIPKNMEVVNRATGKPQQTSTPSGQSPVPTAKRSRQIANPLDSAYLALSQKLLDSSRPGSWLHTKMLDVQITILWKRDGAIWLDAHQSPTPNSPWRQWAITEINDE